MRRTISRMNVVVLSCGFSSEVGLPLRGKRRPGEGGGREGEGEDGGREEDEENEENNFEVMEEEKRMNYIEDNEYQGMGQSGENI